MLNRPFLSMWPCLWRAMLPLAVLIALFLFSDRAGLLLIVMVSASIPVYGWRYRWLWRFGRAVRQFRTAKGSKVVLHFAPDLAGGLDVSVLLQRCEAELRRLHKRFERPLRGRAVVYLFASHRDIGKIFGAHCGGAALSLANAIVIADDNCLQESMRHEFAHLFSARWSVLAPPLLSEGLSVWLQDTWWGQSIDSAVRPLLGARSLKLTHLLDRKVFFSESQRNSCYVMAGSFTGFLIRRYGWQAYRKLFKLCDGFRFRARFKKCFGVSLEKAEWQWRNEILVMQVLNRRLERSLRF